MTAYTINNFNKQIHNIITKYIFNMTTTATTMLTDNKNKISTSNNVTIIIDLDEDYTTIGYSTYNQPTHITHTLLYYNNKLIQYNTYTQYTYKQWCMILQSFIKHIYTSCLHDCIYNNNNTIYHQSCILIIKSYWNDKYYMALITALHSINVYRIECIDSSICTLYSSTHNNSNHSDSGSGLVIDIGCNYTTITPVYQYNIISNAIVICNNTGLMICINKLIDILITNNIQYKQQLVDCLTDNKYELAKNIILQHGYISHNINDNNNNANSDSNSNNVLLDDVILHFDFDDIILTGNDRINICNELFNNTNNNNRNTISLVDSICDGIQLCNTHVRYSIVTNIILTSSSSITIINGSIYQRLYNELISNISYNTDYNVSLQHLNNDIHINDNANKSIQFASNIQSWLGALIYHNMYSNYVDQRYILCTHNNNDKTHTVQSQQYKQHNNDNNTTSSSTVQRCECDIVGHMIDVYRQSITVQ